MIAAVDSHYHNHIAKTALIVFENWSSKMFAQSFAEEREIPSQYISGQFYKRELPGILNVLKNIDLNAIQIIVVDGYVFLNDNGQKGLGADLYDTLKQKIPVIGVAKTQFGIVDTLQAKVFRGKSTNPLFVTAAGMELKVAARHISEMHGNYRTPTLLKKVDKLSREL